MAIKYNGNNTNNVIYKVGNTEHTVNKIILDGTITWCKPFTYTQGTLPTGVATLSCTRFSTDEPSATTGTIANNGTIYYDDKLYWSASASTGYNSPTITYYDASHTLTVTGNITGATYVTAGARISGTYSQGTLPTGVASLTCYRKPYNGSSYSTFTSGTIYYGDKFYWTATPSTGYNNPTTTYYDLNHVYTWTGNQGGSIVGVTVSGLQAGSRITWTATVSLGTGVTKYKYSTNGGTSWSAETSAATVTNLDYSATLTVKASSVEAGYTINTNTATATYSNQNVTVPNATRITWKLSVTMSNYVTGWRYKIGSGSWVNKTASYEITGIDYAQQVTIEGTSKEGNVAYDYGAYQGVGTFGDGSQDSNLSTTLSCTRTRKSFTISFTGTYCSWDSSSITAYYGDTISKSGTTVTCYKWDASTTARWSNTVTKETDTAQYSYGTPVIGTITSPVSAAQTITAESTRTLKSYTITFTNPTYGSWTNATKTAYYGDTLTVNNTNHTVTCAGNSSWTNTCSANATTDQYTYVITGNITVTSPVTGAQTVAAPTSSRTERSYNVTFTNGTYGSWDSTTAITATYSTSISKSGNKVTVGSTVRTYTLPSDTAQYAYTTTINNASGTVGTGKAITATDVRTTKKYAVSITAGTGISSVYLSTTNTAKSGDASGTQYNYGTTVYGFVVLAEHYDIPTDANWVLVDGVKDETGSKYRVGSATISAAHNFGTFNAVIEKYTLTVTKGTGVTTLYYKVNGASSYTSTTGNISTSVNDLSTYYYYATVSSYYTANADCGTSSNPITGTVNCADISKSVSATPKSYKLVGTYTNGSVTWYSNSAMTTAITSANYGSTVYYKYQPNTGYSGSGSGSLTLNTSDFTFSGTSAGSNATHNFGSATVLSYTLTISVTNPSYGTYSVERTSSPLAGATLGPLSNNATIYYGDVLTGSATGAGTSYGAWDVTSVTSPTVTSTGDATSGNLTVTNKDSHTATLYYNTTSATGGTSIGSAAASASLTQTGLSFNTQYYVSARVSRSRDKYVDATDGTQYSGTDGVTGNVTATFKFKRTTTSEAGTIYSSVVSAKTSPQNKYTVTFSVTSGRYGSWNNTSIADVPYGTAITRNNNVVTVGSSTSTFTKPSTTVQYNYGDPSYTVPTSVTGATTVYGGSTRSNRTYTVKWLGSDGTTDLETDSSVAYGATLTYNSSTPTKTSTDQYNYTFSAWKLGSTSGSTVVSGTTTNPGSTSSTTINIYSTFTPTERSYAVTFAKSNSANPGSWSTSSITAPYSASISRSGDTVTVGSAGSATYSNYNATGYTTTVSYGTIPSTVGTGATITASTTRVPKNYTLAATITNGSVKWYSDNAHTTEITKANYNTTVYYQVTANTGYSGTTSGSYVLTTTNFTLDDTNLTATHNFGTLPRITWTMNVTMSDYVTGWRYKIGSGDWVSKTASFNITGIDYASKVTIEGTSKEDAAGYTYGAYVGTGTFGSGSQSGSLSTTLSCTRTRITWTANITLGTGVSKYKYSLNGGSTWSDETTATTVSGIDYAASCIVKSTTAQTGYAVTTNTATATYSSQSVTTPNANRLTWNLSITKGNYMTAVSYSKNGGSAVAVTGTTNLTNLDYADTIVVSGTKYSDTTQYKYTNVTGTGTFTYSASAQSTTVTCTRSIQVYTITWKNWDGTALETDNNVQYGATPSYDGSTPTRAQTAQYTYAFSGWSPTVVSVTGNATYTAQYTPTERSYNVTFTNGTYGTWSSTTTISAKYSDTISLSGNVVTVGSTSRTYTLPSDTAQYTYTTTINNASGTVGTGKAITATDVRSIVSYTITFAKAGGNYGSWSTTSQTAYYGDLLTRSGNIVTCKKWDSTSTTRWTATFTNGSEAAYDYTVSYNSITSPITAAQTITATTSRTRKTFNITFGTTSGKSFYGSWSNSSPQVAYYGDKITVSNQTVTCYKYDATSTARWTNVANASAQTAQYTYSTPVITGSSIDSVTSTASFTAENTRTTRSYPLTLASTFGHWTNSSGTTVTSTTAANYGTTVSVSSNVLTIGSTTYTFVINSDTAQYDYEFSSITGAPASITETGTVTGTATRTTKQYTVTFSAPSGSWSTTSIANVPYGTTITKNGSIITVTGYGSSTYYPAQTTVSQTAGTPEYSYPESIIGATTIVGSTPMTVRKYEIRWVNGDGSILETDENVGYNDTLTYNSSTTPSKAQTDQYSYSFAKWRFESTSGIEVISGTTKNPGSISNTIINIIPTFTQTERSYNVTFTNGTYGSWSSTSSITAAYSTAITITNTSTTHSVKVGSTTRTYTASATGYSFDITVKVAGSTSNTTVGTGKAATATVNRTPNPYNITVTKNTGIDKIYYKVNGASSFIQWTSGTISANYNTTVYWYATALTGYTGNDIGTVSSPKSFTMGTSGTIAPTATPTTYYVTPTIDDISNMYGIALIYFSTSSTATSGTSAGVDIGININNNTVYMFAELNQNYIPPDSWTLISGTAATFHAVYRITSKSFSYSATTQTWAVDSYHAPTCTISFTINTAGHTGYTYVYSKYYPIEGGVTSGAYVTNPSMSYYRRNGSGSSYGSSSITVIQQTKDLYLLTTCADSWTYTYESLSGSSYPFGWGFTETNATIRKNIMNDTNVAKNNIAASATNNSNKTCTVTTSSPSATYFIGSGESWSYISPTTSTQSAIEYIWETTSSSDRYTAAYDTVPMFHIDHKPSSSGDVTNVNFPSHLVGKLTSYDSSGVKYRQYIVEESNESRQRSGVALGFRYNTRGFISEFYSYVIPYGENSSHKYLYEPVKLFLSEGDIWTWR